MLGYEVYVWIEGAWVTYDQDALTSTTQITGLTGGVTYLVKIGAYNKYGVGEVMPSPELTIIAAQEPDAPIDVTVVISGNYALISWTEPFDNYSTITGYYVYVKNNWDDGSQEFIAASEYCSEVSTIAADESGKPNIKGT